MKTFQIKRVRADRCLPFHKYEEKKKKHGED